MSTETPPFSPTPNVTLFLSQEQFRRVDTLLAGILTLCVVVGLPGNIITLLYFHYSKRKDFSRFIYKFVCSVDICTCMVQIPVMMALYHGRGPGVFGEGMFCVGWSVVFYYLQLMSMFLVMLMSVSRTMKLILLQYEIKKKLLLLSFLLYSGFLAIRFTVMLIVEDTESSFGYSRPSVYCSYDLAKEPFSYIDQIINSLCIGCPPLLTTVSFFVFLVLIFRKSQVSKMNQRKRQAALTMAMFTALFLVCNLPCLLNNILWVITEIKNSYPGPFYGGKFMFFYSWLISDVVCTAVNAALNPVLYFSRMMDLRNWVKSLFVGIAPLTAGISFRSSTGP